MTPLEDGHGTRGLPKFQTNIKVHSLAYGLQNLKSSLVEIVYSSFYNFLLLVSATKSKKFNSLIIF